MVRSNIHAIDEDGANDWTGPPVATEYEAMYDYSPMTGTYVYLRNRFLTPTPDQHSVGVFGPDETEHVILGPDPNIGPLPFGETFSPDGQRILFYRSVPLSVAGLHVANIDGTGVTRLVGAGWGGYGSFSPDGTRIAIGGSNQVGVINADGTDGHIIATDSRFNGEVAWSPDGSAIALVGGTGLFLLDPEGVEPPRLVTSDAVSSPNWSPDGSRLAVTHSYTTTPEPRDEIAIVNADGTGFHDVTEVGASWSAVRPAWSPDGTRIAFESDMESAVPANQGGPDVSTSLYVLTLGPDVVALTIDTTSAAPASVPRLGRFEKTFKLSRFYGLEVHDPDVIDVTATFTAPSGAELSVPAWFGTDVTLRPDTGIGGSELYDPVPISPPAPGIWHVRFSPDEVGTWTYRLRAQDHVPGQETTATSAQMTFQVTPSSARRPGCPRSAR